MKNILVVFTTAFTPTGGLTTVMMNYFRAMKKDGLHFDFASTNDPPTNLLDEIKDQHCSYFKLPKRKFIPLYFFALKKLLKNYDIIHVHGNSSTSVVELFAAKVAGVKKRIVHNHTSKSEHPLLNRVLHPLYKRCYTHAIACSNLAGQWLFDESGFHILKNAINIERFASMFNRRNEIRNSLNIANDDFVLGHIGKFLIMKNHVFIVRVFAKIHQKNPRSKLLLVGDGPLRDEIENEIKQQNLLDSVILAGLRTDIPEMLAAMDAFIFPSLWEGLPLSVLEAQASGLPVFLSSNITKEVAASEHCFFMPLSDSAESWSNAIEENVNIDQRKDRIPQNALSLTKAGFNITKEVDDLRKIYLSD